MNPYLPLVVAALGAHASSPVVAAGRACYLPKPRLTVSEWADRYRVIPQGTSPEPGPWRTARAPYLREPMDAISDPTVERVVVQAGSQLGKSDGLLLNAIGYFVDQDPSAILVVQPTEEAATAFSKERIEPTFRESPQLAGRLSRRQRDAKNTIRLRKFDGGYIALAWSNSPVSLASRPIRVLLLDELDLYPDTTGRGGSPIDQAIQRTANFANRKIIMVSTPTDEGTSAIARAYRDSDQRHFNVPCPRCGVDQVLIWKRVIYKRDDGAVDLDDVHYRCEHCGGRIEEREKPWMLEHGTWRADHSERPTRGYQISSLYSPWVRWRELVEQWLRAQGDRDKRGLRDFVNLKLGETWTDAVAQVTVEALEKNRESYAAELPDDVLLLTAGVDVQDNRLEAEIVGWGVGKESFGVAYSIEPGDPADLGPTGPWQRLDNFLSRARLRSDGSGLVVMIACIDSGGHYTDEAYKFCLARTERNFFAIKGAGGPGIPIAGKPTLNKYRAALYHIGVDTAKEVIFSRLALDTVGPGYCHFPTAREAGYDDEYFKGLISEQKKPVTHLGRTVYRWTQTYSRNEPLDCRVYATAALEIFNPDLAAWAAAEEKRRAAGPPAGGSPAPPPRRRVLSRGVE